MKRFVVMCAFLLPFAAWAGRDEAIEAYTTGDFPRALAEFQALADQGDAEGQYFLGLFYHNAFGVKRDQTEALKWFLKAAQQGDARSQYYVGIMYASGQGVAKDLAMADMWLSLSAANPKSSYRRLTCGCRCRRPIRKAATAIPSIPGRRSARSKRR